MNTTMYYQDMNTVRVPPLACVWHKHATKLHLYSCSMAKGGREPSLKSMLSISDFVLWLSPKLRDKIRNGEPGFEASKNLVPDEAELQLMWG